MEHTSKPQPLVIARVFASLAPTMYLNMYSFGRHDKSRRTRLSMILACSQSMSARHAFAPRRRLSRLSHADPRQHLLAARQAEDHPHRRRTRVHRQSDADLGHRNGIALRLIELQSSVLLRTGGRRMLAKYLSDFRISVDSDASLTLMSVHVLPLDFSIMSGCPGQYSFRPFRANPSLQRVAFCFSGRLRNRSVSNVAKLEFGNQSHAYSAASAYGSVGLNSCGFNYVVTATSACEGVAVDQDSIRICSNIICIQGHPRAFANANGLT